MRQAGSGSRGETPRGPPERGAASPRSIRVQTRATPPEGTVKTCPSGDEAIHTDRTETHRLRPTPSRAPCHRAERRRDAIEDGLHRVRDRNATPGCRGRAVSPRPRRETKPRPHSAQTRDATPLRQDIGAPTFARPPKNFSRREDLTPSSTGLLGAARWLSLGNDGRALKAPDQRSKGAAGSRRQAGRPGRSWLSARARRRAIDARAPSERHLVEAEKKTGSPPADALRSLCRGVPARLSGAQFGRRGCARPGRGREEKLPAVRPSEAPPAREAFGFQTRATPPEGTVKTCPSGDEAIHTDRTETHRLRPTPSRAPCHRAERAARRD
uniref:Uncharacterized protein n=1 Tax=Branchiostoma floridae TaxID=7739 RepID=C3YVQ8_BRAFL|eukprot:XP_002599580.1 hypothetical protein BRAFLDRAFT_77679 [Branchiostoma floridae]